MGTLEFAATPQAAGTGERSEDQRCKKSGKPSVLRAAQVTHKGVLPTTNPAPSQHQMYLGEP